MEHVLPLGFISVPNSTTVASKWMDTIGSEGTFFRCCYSLWSIVIMVNWLPLGSLVTPSISLLLLLLSFILIDFFFSLVIPTTKGQQFIIEKHNNINSEWELFLAQGAVRYSNVIFLFCFCCFDRKLFRITSWTQRNDSNSSPNRIVFTTTKIPLNCYSFLAYPDMHAFAPNKTHLTHNN